ncbi:MULTISPECIES: ABC transporter substrate-binding protein [unclassified Mesorhizobium]|uniref:ABC transporter substrate-binding protein n=1 Tax=unclassified Mesorhizobium TaxID=325217 RepID=UPI00041AC104|nr:MULTISPECIES: ABC transporter substrate-binding protein [unclassified Mesorhizobium]WJI55586.1 ABC transporter substrate-binding protein [Mesorhizobium sp. C432A]
MDSSKFITIHRRSFLTGLSGMIGIAAGGSLFPSMVAAAADNDTLRIAISVAPGDLDPHKFKGLYAVQDMVFEPLVTYSYDGKIEPGLATAWSIENEGKLLRLTLREQVVFHDGTPFDATAAKWNLGRWMGQADNNWMNCSRLFVDATVVDDNHIDIRFKEPVLGLLQELAYVRPGRFLSPKSVAADGSYKAPVGTGPWREISADNSGSVFERFDRYWGEKPKFSKVQLKVLPDSRGRMAALRAGDIDLMGGAFVSPITAIEAQTLKQAGLDVVVEPGSTTMIMAFNPDRAPALKEVAVRKAIDIGIDRAAISKVLYRGMAATSANLFAESVPLAGKRYEVPQIDVEGAKALLEKAGWVGSPVREKDGSPLALEIVVSEEQIPGSRSVAEVLQAELQEIGIQLTIRSVDHASRHSDIPERKFDLAFFQTYGAPYEPFATIVGLFLSTYDNGVDGKLFVDAERLDPLVTATMSALDPNMEANVQKVYDWLHDNVAIAPLLYVPGIWAHSSRVKDFKAPATEYDMPYENISLSE